MERARVNRTLYVSREKGRIDEAVQFPSLSRARYAEMFLRFRLSRHFLNPLDRLRKSLFPDLGKDRVKNLARAALPASSSAMMPSMHIKYPL